MRVPTECHTRRGTSKGEGAENGYFAYPLPSGSLNESLEGVLAQIEDHFAKVLVGLSIGNFAPDPANRRATAEYVGLMFARSRGRLAGTQVVLSKVSTLMHQLEQDGFLDDIATAATNRYGSVVTRDQIAQIVRNLAENNLTPVETKRAFLSDLLFNAGLTSDSLMKLPWQVWLSTGASECVPSDTPVSTALFGGGRLLPGVGFGVRGALVFFPLSPRACLVMGHSGKPYQPVRPQVIDAVNLQTIMFARMHLYSRLRSAKIDDQVQQHIAQVKIGENAFVITGNYLPVLKQVIAQQFGLAAVPSGESTKPDL